jgi:hypothetical protein
MLEDPEGRALVAAIHERKARAPFDPSAPLPDLHTPNSARSWEPAARHYRDLTEDEKQGLTAHQEGTR